MASEVAKVTLHEFVFSAGAASSSISLVCLHCIHSAACFLKNPNEALQATVGGDIPGHPLCNNQSQAPWELLFHVPMSSNGFYM